MNGGLLFVALWREDGASDTLHLLSRGIHIRLPFPALGADNKAIEEFLPQITEAIPSPAPLTRWLLLLEPSLPKEWFSLNWESLRLAGHPLTSQALVVRRAVWGSPQSGAGGNNRFINLFPATEFPFADRLQPTIQSGMLRTSRKAFLKADMSATDHLFITAHGLADGLVDADGNSFEIPAAHPMPRCIWLLACNVGGAMDLIAQRLLGQGCRTVIAATSDLSAPEMADLVEGLFADESCLNEPVSWLSQTTNTVSAGGSANALTVWGDVDLDPPPGTPWNKLIWEHVHDTGQPLPLSDEITLPEFHEAYRQSLSPFAWPLTRDEMSSPLLLLAEKHDHTLISPLSKLVGDIESPKAIRSLAAAARRMGNYIGMAKYLSKGLNLPDLTSAERADYLGALANLFIDMDLPESAAQAIEHHGNCHHDAPRDRVAAQFKCLDWMARTEARRGRLHVALDHMTTKRRQAPEDSGRELAGQLYLAAWGLVTGQVPQKTAISLAAEVEKRLSESPPLNIGQGNETTAYLLRAFAAYAWANNDLRALGIAGGWLEYAQSRLTDHDPGPWAYTIAFLHLRKATSPELFDRAISALERNHYYLEAAILLSFSDRKTYGQNILTRFHRKRMDVVLALQLESDALSPDPIRESQSRCDSEKEAFDRPHLVSKLGILPL